MTSGHCHQNTRRGLGRELVEAGGGDGKGDKRQTPPRCRCLIVEIALFEYIWRRDPRNPGEYFVGGRYRMRAATSRVFVEGPESQRRNALSIKIM